MGNPLLGIKLKQMLMFKQIPKLIRQTNWDAGYPITQWLWSENRWSLLGHAWQWEAIASVVCCSLKSL
jgi:hypothetical protein